MTQISDGEAAELHGISGQHQQMDNGELRFRLMSSDGSGYIRTEAGVTGAWQHAHWHRSAQETYIVQRGWMVLVQLQEGGQNWERLDVNDVITTKPLVAHNVYLPAHAVLHTVKHGSTEAEEWHASPELDELTRDVSELAARRYAADPHRKW